MYLTFLRKKNTLASRFDITSVLFGYSKASRDFAQSLLHRGDITFFLERKNKRCCMVGALLACFLMFFVVFFF